MIRAWFEEWVKQYVAIQARKQTLAELEAEVEKEYRRLIDERNKAILQRPWWWRFVGLDHIKNRKGWG